MCGGFDAHTRNLKFTDWTVLGIDTQGVQIPTRDQLEPSILFPCSLFPNGHTSTPTQNLHGFTKVSFNISGVRGLMVLCTIYLCTGRDRINVMKLLSLRPAASLPGMTSLRMEIRSQDRTALVRPCSPVVDSSALRIIKKLE